jgi:uncharacterized protein (UPF0335 family)
MATAVLDRPTETVAAEQLRLFIERVERLEEEKRGISDGEQVQQ